MLTEKQIEKWSHALYEKVKEDKSIESRNYIHFLTRLVNRVYSFKDAPIAVCGERGMGKTSYSITSGLILKVLSEEIKKPVKFDFYKNIFYNAEDLIKSVDSVVSSEKNAFIYDEMIDFAYSREAMTRTNRNAKKLFTQLRKLNNIYFFSLPYFIELDPAFRDRLVNFWVEMVDKSANKNYDKNFFLSSFQMKDINNPINPDKWGINRIAKIYEQQKTFTHEPKHQVMKKFPSFICYFRSPAVPKVIFEEYNKIAKEYIQKSKERLIANIGTDLKEDKKEYDAVCSDCGDETTVPFKPTSGKKIWCKKCYKSHTLKISI